MNTAPTINCQWTVHNDTRFSSSRKTAAPTNGPKKVPIPPSRDIMTTMPDVSMCRISIGTMDRCKAINAPARPQNAPDRMNVISRVYVGKRLATLICLALVCFFTFNAFIFLTHYEFMGIMMTSKEMFFALTNTSRWFERIVLSHISLMLLLFFLTLALAFAALYAKWIYRSAYCLSPKWIPKNRKSYSVIHRMLQFLVFFGCLWLFLRWASECFPLHDYETARQYNEYIEYIKNTTL